MSDWQPIETAPKDGTWILTQLYGVCGAKCHVMCFLNDRWNSSTYSHCFMEKDISGWMPLPEVPKQPDSWHRCKHMPQKYRIEVDEWPDGYFSSNLKTSTETALERIRFCPYCGASNEK